MTRMFATPDHTFMTGSEVTKNLTRALVEAGRGDVVITQYGRPVGVLRGFLNRGDWLDYRLESDAKFQAQVAAARARLWARSGIVEDEGDPVEAGAPRGGWKRAPKGGPKPRP